MNTNPNNKGTIALFKQVVTALLQRESFKQKEPH